MPERSWPAGAILRDIVRGGLAGLVVGLAVGGIGSRVVMRIAALLVPEAVGLRTENDNVIGEITLGGSLALVVFIGLLATVSLATVWVVISPWLPRTMLRRALVTTPVAVALGAVAIVEGTNPDFVILGHNPIVVVSLLLLIATMAPAMVLADTWLDRRMPRPTGVRSTSGFVYAALAAIGVLLGGLIALASLGSRNGWPLAVTLIGVGLVTVAWWALRLQGDTEPPRSLTVAGRGLLVAGTVLGLVTVTPEVMAALGLR